MGVTIKDVAKKTGLSITTVSLVLNKKESRIPEKTRQIVESAALELNYSPNHAAISLATRRTGVIALVLPEESHYRPADFLVPAEHACRNAGYGLMLKLVENDDESALETVAALARRGVEGIVFDPSKLGAGSADDYAELLARQDTPVVSVGGVGAQILPNSIVPDHRRGGYLAVRHLLELGHRVVGCLPGPEESPAARDIVLGCRDALDEEGLGEDCLFIVSGKYSAAKGEEGMRALHQQGVAAVLAGSMALAQGVYRFAYSNGLRIPDDISVVGYGDGYPAEDMIVPLTAVSLHFDRFARKTVGLVKKLGGRKSAVAPEIVYPSLVIRESAAGAR